MSVVVLVELKVQGEKVDEFTAFIASIVEETRNYEGCNSMTFNINQDDPTNIVFIESWDTRDQYEKYFAWRQESGALDSLSTMLSGAPILRFFDPVEM